MPQSVIAEGLDLNEIAQFDSRIKPGQFFTVEITSPDIIDNRESIRDILEDYPVSGVNIVGDTLTLTLQKQPEGHIGLIWWLPVLAVGGVLTGIFGWKILSYDPTDFLIKSIPFVLLGLGAILVIVWASKK